MFTVALFVSQDMKQPKSPSVDEWIKKMWSMDKMEFYSVI